MKNLQLLPFFVLTILALTVSVPLSASETDKSSSSAKSFSSGDKKLIVFSDVPGVTPSKFYQIRVRSLATDHQWIECFAHSTNNKAQELGGKSIPRLDGTVVKTGVKQYVFYTSEWSHSYANIEMSQGLPVEVEISSKNGFQIGGKAFLKAAAHPAHRVAIQPTVKDGKVIFVIDKPGQFTIDINGQLDDINKVIDNKPNYIAHTVSLFANPVFEKPSLEDAGVIVVDPNSKPPTDPNLFTTLIFKPGSHDIGINYKIYPNKKYYIPGDAIISGTMNNREISKVIKGEAEGENIKIWGSGTITGANIAHPAFVQGADDKDYRTVFISGGDNTILEGICIADPAMHSVILESRKVKSEAYRDKTFARWVKVISWRANGDGIGSADVTEDCFLRTNDDNAYIKGSKRRTVFWKDGTAAIFHMTAIPEASKRPQIVIEDCDVIYNRSRDPAVGGVFVQRGEGQQKQIFVNVLVKDFRITDPRPNAPVFKLVSKDTTRKTKGEFGSSYSGIIFQNITITSPTLGNRKQEIIGCEGSPWYGGLTFDNVTVAGKKITGLDYFQHNEFVKDVVFK